MKVIGVTIIVWIVTIFMLLVVGNLEISFNPLRVHLGKPWQLIGIILISIGVAMMYHQGKLDSNNNEETEISVKDQDRNR